MHRIILFEAFSGQFFSNLPYKSAVIKGGVSNLKMAHPYTKIGGETGLGMSEGKMSVFVFFSVTLSVNRGIMNQRLYCECSLGELQHIIKF